MCILSYFYVHLHDINNDYYSPPSFSPSYERVRCLNTSLDLEFKQNKAPLSYLSCHDNNSTFFCLLVLIVVHVPLQCVLPVMLLLRKL